VPLTPRDATVVVVNWNGAHLLPACLDALRGEGADVLVVDNASTDGSRELLAAGYPWVRVVLSPENTGFAGGVALALPQLDTPVLALVNNDAQVRPGWLTPLLAELDSDGVAAASSKLLLPDGRINSAGGMVTAAGYGHDRAFGHIDDGSYDTTAEIMYACGAAVALKIEAVRAVGGVDPRFFLYYEDVDLSWRLRLAGYSVRYVPTSVAVHQHSASSGAGSLLHTYYSERNRLATLTVCATAGLAVRAALRYPLTTLSVAVGESRAKAWQRARAYVDYLRWLPALLRRRRSVICRVSRPDVERLLTPERR
jgi:GT2 family glycosyltransferase